MRMCLQCGRKTNKYSGKYCGSVKEKVGCAYVVGLEQVRTWLRTHRKSHRSYLKKYREVNKERLSVYYAKWYATNGRKRIRIAQKAHGIVSQAVKMGRLTRPENCSECKISKSEKRIEAHHPDYSKPLEIEWLCQPCHQAKHHSKTL